MKRVTRLAIVVAVLLGVSAFLASMIMVIYPGAFKLTAPVLCPDDLPDPVVVEYTVETSDGQGINFTLFCVGDRGVFTEVGTWRPLLLLTLYVAGALLVVMVGLAGFGMVKAAFGTRSGGSPPPAAPTPEDASPLIS